ncbi:MAG: tRNA (adenosine(37)-N6)-dimethylallyltransferase MiaA [Patescibacteria group bacterium]|nr:tRNA (adenosine(37)-N6)-dimethylallyltransferase MiaA [Patescibacteria group bacterium]MDE2438067.1 tRNA (adenosine(37)-N6)-dimethylallyltransferase MiaA [Patescibacteria group bacterium]
MKKSMRPCIIAVVGPTASGKSDCAVEIARHVHGEVISADSRQVYRLMNIGTGKITSREMKGVPHHLLDVASPRRQFTVMQYQKQAENAIREIMKRGNTPIFCGGTGLYIDAVLEGWEFPRSAINHRLRKTLEKKSITELFGLLQKLDPAFAHHVDSNNPRRIIRAIEIITETHQPIRPLQKHPIPYPVIIVGIFPGFEMLRKKIRKRLAMRLTQGMIEEIQALHATQGISWKRLESFGLEYKHVAFFLQEKCTYENMQQSLESAILHYAKRQMTWFRRKKNIIWFQTPHDACVGILRPIRLMKQAH